MHLAFLQADENAVVIPGSVPELDRERQARQFVDQMGQVQPVLPGPFERRPELNQDGQEGAPLDEGGDALAEFFRFLAPVFRIHLMGHGARQLHREGEALRHSGEHAFHGKGLGHLVPGVIDLDGVKPPAVIGQHILAGRSGRIEPVGGPFRV